MHTLQAHSFSNKSALRSFRGFSLVEMLIVIAVVGIIAAIAVPNIANINSTSKIVVAKRTAQDVVSVFNAGLNAGAPSFVAAATVREAYAAVNAGDYGTGTMSSVYFGIPGLPAPDYSLSDPERDGYYIGMSNGTLYYDPAGGHFN